MRWNRKARARLAKMVWDKSTQIDEEVRACCTNLFEYTSERDWRIPAYFERAGFSISCASEWSYDPSSNHPALFKPERKHLFFLICTQNVMKVERDLASKFLFLGLP